jgi:hypothetical protein
MSLVKGSRFTVMSMNVHKGLSPLHRHSTIYQLRQNMRMSQFHQWPLPKTSNSTAVFLL